MVDEEREEGGESGDWWVRRYNAVLCSQRA